MKNLIVPKICISILISVILVLMVQSVFAEEKRRKKTESLTTQKAENRKKTETSEITPREQLQKLMQPPEFPVSPQNSVFQLILSGARYGQLEPCQCKVKQQGGIDREYMILKELEHGIPRIQLDAGGTLYLEYTEHEALKGNYLQGAMAKLGVDAINVSWNDLNLGYQQLIENSKKHNIPYISANIIDTKTSDTIFLPFLKFP